MATYRGDLMDDLNDMLMGGMGNDILWGGMGDDTLHGGAGDDRLIGGPGGDALDGGAGSDTADYAMSDAGVYVDLSTPFGRNDDDDPGPVHSGHAEGDSLQSIENIWGSSYSDTLTGNHVANMLFGRGGNDEIDGSLGNDKIWGNAGADYLMGGAGDDTLFGGSDDDLLMGGAGNDLLMGQAGDDVLQGDAGNDILEGGMGADDLDGGAGTSDTAAYTMSEEGVTINLAHAQDASPLTPGPSGGDAAGDTLTGIENLRGSDDDDKLTGDTGANKLYGNMGDDMLMGAEGNDMLRGGKGDDELDGGEGNDTIQGDKGDDVLTGGDGNDTFVLMEGDGDDTIEDFESGEDTIRFGKTALTASDIRDILDTEDESRDGFTYEWEDVSVTVDRPLTASDFGTKAPSTSLDNGDNNWPDGDDSDGEPYFDTSTAALRAAKDRVVDGDNVIHGLAGDDTIMGGDGDDTLYGNTGNDELMGEDDDDTLSGGPGDDMLMGGDDDDTLKGGSGDDTLVGGRHDDELSGGPGVDVFKFGERDGRDNITGFAHGVDKIKLVDDDGNLATADDIEELLEEVRENDDGYYTYSWKNTSFTVDENLEASDFYMEQEQEQEPYRLGRDGETWPGTGVDNSGDDTVYGGIGPDTIMGGRGNDWLEGRDGNDTLMGGAGHDVLWGGVGADMLTGGDGEDHLFGQRGDDTFKFDDDDGYNYIRDFEAGDKIMLGSDPLPAGDVDGVIATKTAGNRLSYAYEWEDTTFEVDKELEPGDFVMADAPPDPTIMVPDSTPDWPGTGVSNRGDDKVQGGDVDNEFTGGRGDDTLMGGKGNDVLTGENGDDKLEGGDGDDNLTGGDGDDMLDGGAGNDTLAGGEDDDMLYADHEDNIANLTGGDGEDTLSFMNSSMGIGTSTAAAAFTTGTHSIEHLMGSPKADHLSLESVAADPNDATVVPTKNTLSGGGGNDTLTGGAGADTIMGGDGDDVINGLGDADVLTGGAGSDTFTWGNGDTITDYNVSEDERIAIPAGGTAPTAENTTFDMHNGMLRVTVGSESMLFEGLSVPTSDYAEGILLSELFGI